MAGFFGKLVKGLMIGAGTVLSLIPGFAVVGAPLVVAGAAIKTSGTTGTIDPLSTYSKTLVDTIPTAGAMASASKASTFFNDIINWVQQNIVIVMIGAAALFFLVFKRPKRRRR